MTNIIKKIKRKHKKKKLQAEYAKMEQSRQNRTPEDAYQERLSKHRSAAIRRAMMTVVAVVAVATLFFFYHWLISAFASIFFSMLSGSLEKKS